MKPIKDWFKAKWFGSVMWFIILTIFYLAVNSGEIYYTHMPMSTFAETHVFFAPDVTVGDTKQIVHFNTSVHLAHDITVIRELNLINTNSRQVVYKKTVTVPDRVQEGIVYVTYDIPGDLEPGTYVWAIGLTRHLPHDVDRFIISYSNNFEVKE